MTSRERNALKKSLLALEAELSAKGIARIAPNRLSEEEVGGDEDEQPLNEMMQAIASNRNKNLDVVLVKVRAALQKLSERPEDFGACEDCGEDIGGGRLKAMPYAELCVACQAKKDAPKGGPTRRKTTEFI